MIIFSGIICAILYIHRRKVANYKKEINHFVRYTAEDRNNFDNPVYSYQPGSSTTTTDAATLLRRGALPKRPLQNLNILEADSSLSGRSTSYALQYDPTLMNQKNHEADLTNPNFYNGFDDHLYAEIKLKADNGEF